MKVKTLKGFTLAELLIVMAIITVLAAVAIPSFTRQLETSRETADLETLRNAYTEAFTQALKDVSDTGAVSTDANAYTITGLKFVQATPGFDYISGKIGVLPLQKSTESGTANGTKTLANTNTQVKFTFTIATADDTATPPAFKKGDLYLSALAGSDS